MKKAYWERQEGKRTVWGPIYRTLADAFLSINSASAQAGLIQKILAWLQSGFGRPSPQSMQEEGTCEWIFSHPAYTTWSVEDYPRPLWINGIPGHQRYDSTSWFRSNLNLQDAENQ